MKALGDPYLPMYRYERMGRSRRRRVLAVLQWAVIGLLVLVVLHLALRELGA